MPKSTLRLGEVAPHTNDDIHTWKERNYDSVFPGTSQPPQNKVKKYSSFKDAKEGMICR